MLCIVLQLYSGNSCKERFLSVFVVLHFLKQLFHCPDCVEVQKGMKMKNFFPLLVSICTK